MYFGQKDISVSISLCNSLIKKKTFVSASSDSHEFAWGGGIHWWGGEMKMRVGWKVHLLNCVSRECEAWDTSAECKTRK